MAYITDVYRHDAVWAATVGLGLIQHTVGKGSPHKPFSTGHVYIPENGDAAIFKDIYPAHPYQVNLQVDNSAVYLFGKNANGCLDAFKAAWQANPPSVPFLDPFCRESTGGQVRIGFKLDDEGRARAPHGRAALLAGGLEVLTYWTAANHP